MVSIYIGVFCYTRGMKKLPKSYTVLGQKIKITQKLEPQYLDRYAEYNLYGLYMHDKLEIYVSPDQSLESQWRTLFHELGHALCYRSGLAFDDQFRDGLHEQLVELYANFIYESFHDKK